MAIGLFLMAALKMKNTITTLRNAAVIAFILGGMVLSTSAAVIDIADYSATPDGSTTDFNQLTDIKTLNGGAPTSYHQVERL